MSGSRIFAALAALAVAAPAAAQDFRTIGASETVVLDPSRSYLIVQISAGGGALPFPLTFVRRPEQADIDDYLERRAAALDKAHAKWVRRHADWERALVSWRKYPRPDMGPAQRPIEPVEPTDANLAFPAIEQERMMTLGPFNRFSKADGRSTFVEQVPPGRYAFYGPVGFLQAVTGTCMCMGTIEFEVKPGQIVHAGMMKINLMAERARARAEKRPLPANELDLPDTMNSIGWEMPVAGAAIDPRLAGYAIVPAELRAAGRFPNYYGLQIDRMTPIPGVLAYERDRIIDVKTGAQVR